MRTCFILLAVAFPFLLFSQREVFIDTTFENGPYVEWSHAPSLGIIPEGECIVRIGRYTFHSPITSRFYPGDEGDTKTILRIILPKYRDTVIVRDSDGSIMTLFDNLQALEIEQFMGYIPLADLDSLLNAEVSVIDKNDVKAVEELGVYVGGTNGKHFYKAKRTSRIGGIPSIADYIRKSPCDNYLVLETLEFREKKYFTQNVLKKVGWKIIRSP